MATKYIVLWVFLLFIAKSAAQNLVKNPSFEAFLKCPERLGNFDDDVTSWSTPTEGSTDYFNGCSTAMGTPKNFNGTQPANFGTGYAGLYLYAPDNYREYLQVELTETLTKGKRYSISFYVSLAERSDFAVKEFGVLFSHSKLEVAGKRELSKGKIYKESIENYNFMEIGYSNFYSDTKDWILVNTQFVAKGTENYLTMGNFKPNARTRMFRTKKGARKGAYYYVDMFKVEATDTTNQTSLAVKTDNKLKTNFALDKIHVFENVLFDFDKFNLLPSAKKEMQELFDYINNDTSLQITIQGHTDSVGSKFYNKSLSGKRAQAVANYLQYLGLADDRIFWEGYGGKKPVATNNTEAGRQQNRRVEFLITKKGKVNR
jgi:outer membrane protein OmpA-like peptidoglycan-associated protein